MLRGQDNGILRRWTHREEDKGKKKGRWNELNRTNCLWRNKEAPPLHLWHGKQTKDTGGENPTKTARLFFSAKDNIEDKVQGSRVSPTWDESDRRLMGNIPLGAPTTSADNDTTDNIYYYSTWRFKYILYYLPIAPLAG